MRTTLTIDDDVAIQLDHLRKATRGTFKTVVNSVLRAGVQHLQSPPRSSSRRFRTEATSLGKCRLGSLVSVSEALAVAEGEDFR